MCVPDRMHHADLGLFQYQLRFTVELLNLKCGSGPIKILEERLTLGVVLGQAVVDIEAFEEEFADSGEEGGIARIKLHFPGERGGELW